MNINDPNAVVSYCVICFWGTVSFPQDGSIPPSAQVIKWGKRKKCWWTVFIRWILPSSEQLSVSFTNSDEQLYDT